MKEFKKFRTEIFGFISIKFSFVGARGTWLTYNSYDYSAGYVFGMMKPDNYLSIVFVMVVF